MSGASPMPPLVLARLKNGPVPFSGFLAWLDLHGVDEAVRMFDSFGWKAGWFPVAELARLMYPDLAPSSAQNYVRALLQYLVVEGELEQDPQVWIRHGKVCFDSDNVMVASC